MKRSITIIILLNSILSFGQQDPRFSGYGFTPLTYNPASYGVWNDLSFNLTGRIQFPGLEDDIRTLNFSSEYRIDLDKADRFTKGGMAVGLNFMAESSGHYNFQDIEFPFNKFLELENSKLALAISPGVRRMKKDFLWITPQDSIDPNLPETESTFLLDMGVGVMWFKENFYFGFAATHLFEPRSEKTGYKMDRYYYLNTGFKFKVGDFGIYPLINVRSIGSFSLIETLCYFQTKNELISVGVGYAHGSAILSGFAVKFKGVRLAYHLDYNTNPLGKYTSFNHELRLGFMFDRE